MRKPVWLNLGCSTNVMPGYVNVDKREFSYAEMGFASCLEADLEGDWRWCEDSTVDYILAADIIEHLRDKIHTMNEMWRVLRPGGVVRIDVPTTDGPGAWQDPTHVSFWNANSFFYFEDGNPHRERFGKDYGIKARFKIINKSIELLPNNVRKLTITLEAVK